MTTAPGKRRARAAPAPHDDPRPLPPEPPQPDDCCHSGCAHCVQDLYEEALDQYRARLSEWQARHP